MSVEIQLVIVFILIINVIFLITLMVYGIRSLRWFVLLKDYYHRTINKKKIDQQLLKTFSYKLGGVLVKMSNDVVGGIIVLERNDRLDQYVKIGFPVQSEFSSEFVVNVFYNKSSPLHDGGIIVRDTKIIALSSYFPVSQKNLPAYYGARHRAGIGICELTDALAFIVSETSGAISVVKKGEIIPLGNDIDQIGQKIYSIISDQVDYQSDQILISNDLEQN